MANSPIELDNTTRSRLWILLLATGFIVAAFTTPWWTRGLTIDEEAAGIDGDIPMAEGFYVHYGPFETGSALGVGTDASRETVTGILGILMVSSVAFVAASFVLRFLRNRGSVVSTPDVPVALAITGFGLGIAAVLTGVLFVPLMGTDPGFAWGDEADAAFDGDGIETTRYANAGFFFGIVALVVFPVYAWVDAANARIAEDNALHTSRPTPSASVGTSGSASTGPATTRARKATVSLE